jgi:hypothetical protein
MHVGALASAQGCPVTDLDRIIAELEEYKTAIENALAALGGVAGTTVKRRGRPPGKRASGTAPAKKRRNFSDATRKRLADAMQKRWAAKRVAANKSAAKKTARTISSK